LPLTAPYCPVLPRTAPYCPVLPVLPRTAPYCPVLPRTAPYYPVLPRTAQISPFLSHAVNISVDDVNGGQGGGGAARARTWTIVGGCLVLKAGGGSASAKSVDSGAISAVFIESAQCMSGVRLPRLPPHCTGRVEEWGGVQTCFFALWRPSLTFCDVFAVYSCLHCRLSVCSLLCAPTLWAQNLDKNSMSRFFGTTGTSSQVFRACEATLFEASVLG